MVKLGRMRVPTLVAALTALALLAGCGGDDETTSPTRTAEGTYTAATGPTGPEQADEVDPPAETEGDSSGDGASTGAGSDPEGALEAFFTSGDPELVCGEIATPELI